MHGVDVRTPAPPWHARAVRSALLLAGLLGACVAVAALSATGRLTAPCLLRAATGLPCPLCGGTTAAVAVGTGRPLDALAASPLAVLGAATLALVPVVPARLRARAAASRTPLLLTALALGELWQLARLT